jgi:glutamine amidotransferase
VPKNVNFCNTEYGEKFISFVEKDNIFGSQFHPEKSHKTGLKLIKNFLDL